MLRTVILAAAMAAVTATPAAAKPVLDNEPHLYLTGQILGGHASGKGEQLQVQSWHWGPRQSTARTGATDLPKELQAEDRMGDPASARGHSMLGASDRTVIHDPPPPRDGGLGSESELAATGSSRPQRGSLTVQASLPGCTVGARYAGAQFAGGSMRYELKDVVISNCASGSVTLDFGKVTVKGWNPEKKEL
jgi:hypothetical protein